MQLLFLRQWLSDETLKALGWTFIHSLWQGLLAAVLAAIIIISTRKSSANLRYNLLGSVILGFLVATGITFYNELATGLATSDNTVLSVGPSAGNYFTSVTNETTIAAPAGFLDGFINWFNVHADIFVMVWLLFFIINCLKLFTGLASVHRLRYYKVQAPPESWTKKLQQLSVVLGVRQQVSLLQSELVKVPVAVGILKPVILVPMGLLMHLPPDQVETILLHELAHIRRRDYFINLLQRLTEAIFFFNPALRWISSLLRQEREACCDDIVVANTTHRRSYLDALVSFQEFASSAPAYAMGISSKRHYMLERVRRMITRENRKLCWMERMTLVAGMMVLTAFTVISQADMTEEKKDKQPVTTTEQEAVVAKSIEPKPMEHKAEQKATGYKSRTSVALEAAKPLKLQRREIRNMMIMTLQPRDTPRIRIVPAISLNDQSYRVLQHSQSVKKETGESKETTVVVGPDGKKYLLRKLSGTVVALFIGNHKVPEKQLPGYSELVEKIEQARIANSLKLTTENQWQDARQQAELEHKKAELNKMNQEIDKANTKIKSGKQKNIFLQKTPQTSEVHIDIQRVNKKEEKKEPTRELKLDKKPESNLSGIRTYKIDLKTVPISLQDSTRVHKRLFAYNTNPEVKLFNKRSRVGYAPRALYKPVPPPPSSPRSPKEPDVKKNETISL